MNTRNIPALIMLTAGLVAAVLMYIRHYELHTLLWILLAVLIVFYIFGLVIRKMLDTFGMQIEAARQEQEKEAEQDALLEENQDGAVIEKQ